MPWVLTRGEQRWEGIPPGRATANSPELLIRLARSGAGITTVSDHFAEPYVRSAANWSPCSPTGACPRHCHGRVSRPPAHARAHPRVSRCAGGGILGPAVSGRAGESGYDEGASPETGSLIEVSAAMRAWAAIRHHDATHVCTRPVSLSLHLLHTGRRASPPQASDASMIALQKLSHWHSTRRTAARKLARDMRSRSTDTTNRTQDRVSTRTQLARKLIRETCAN